MIRIWIITKSFSFILPSQPGDTKPKAIEKATGPNAERSDRKGIGETVPRALGLSRSDWGYEAEGDRKGPVTTGPHAERSDRRGLGKPFPVPWGCHEVTGDTKPKAIEKGQ